MTRTIGGAAAGAAFGVLFLIAGVYVARYLFPLPPDTGLSAEPDPNVMVARAGPALLIALLVVHALAAAVAGVAAGRIAMDGERPIQAGVGLFLVAAVAYVLIVPHPIWFVMASVLVVLAVGYGLGRLAKS
jgi:hypothetical protein